jgi:tetratricopeptide (TPR) repeat protein
VKIARLLAVVAIALALIAPEFARYRGERHLYQLNGAMQLYSAAPGAQRKALLLRLSNDAARLRTYPGDWRPLTLAGSASMQANNYAQAASHFQSALSHGERPELDLNLGLALRAAGDHDAARPYFVRGVWLSPASARHLPPIVAQNTELEVARLTKQLRAGKLRPEDL